MRHRLSIQRIEAVLEVADGDRLARRAKHLDIAEPFRRGDQRDRRAAAREIRPRAADRIAPDHAAGEQRAAADLALAGFVDADRRIIESVAGLARDR